MQKTDILDVRLLAEQWLTNKDAKTLEKLIATTKAHPATLQELAAEYANAGLWYDGTIVLNKFVEATPESAVSPLIYYYLGDFSEKLGDLKLASDFRIRAQSQSIEYVFPFQYELIPILNRAMELNPRDSRAPYYLGNLLFDGQPEEACRLWEKSTELDAKFFMSWRNLSVKYSHESGDTSINKAISILEKAIAQNDPYPVHYAELDKLYQAAGAPVEKRLAVLEQNLNIIMKNDESMGSLISLKTFTGNPDEAIKLLEGRTFIMFEGGSAYSTGQAWADAHLVRGLKSFKLKKYKEALVDFMAAVNIPDNLHSEQRTFRAADINYWTGCALAAIGKNEEAKQSWKKVLQTNIDRQRLGGGGQPLVLIRASQGEQRYYQALAKRMLGLIDEADAIFHGLKDTVPASLQQGENAGSVSFSLNRAIPQLSKANDALIHYYVGLGYAGLGNDEKAFQEFNRALVLVPDLLSAKIALDQL